MSPVPSVAIRVEPPDKFRITATQRRTICVTVQPHRRQRFNLRPGKAGERLSIRASARCPAANLGSASADGIQRIIEIRPARHSASPCVGAKHPGFSLPSRNRRLCAQNFLCAHSFEPVVTGIEFPHMTQAEPAPVARPVKARRAASRRTKFARLGAARNLAVAPVTLYPSVEPVMHKAFSMASECLYWKSPD